MPQQVAKDKTVILTLTPIDGAGVHHVEQFYWPRQDRAGVLAIQAAVEEGMKETGDTGSGGGERDLTIVVNMLAVDPAGVHHVIPNATFPRQNGERLKALQANVFKRLQAL